MNPNVGALFLESILLAGGLGILLKQVASEIFKPPYEHGLLVEQIFQIGARSFPLILITAISTGMVMTLQFGIGLEKFGGQPYVPKIVSLSILREMGPVFTSLMVAARVGAGIASEVGSMVVTQQIDAMRALGTSPIKKIVVPRVLALLITLPLLCSLANMIGITGATIIGITELKMDPEFFVLKITSTLKLKDLFTGLGKSVFFALFISTVSCYYGLNVKEGTKEVGIATTKAVVVSSTLILVGDFFLTKLFWMIERWL
ncbi:MAG: ABC transporter permease [Oligoflexia bacterium]|nr:MAG: ABC transporter permease [Oligoflexia bacterium]